MTALVCGLVACFSAIALAAELESPSSAEICGDCHRAIHEGWKKSAHARAMDSRLFQDAVKLAEADNGPSARKLCLSCHSPVGVQTGDLALIRKVSWEGVTCDHCHSIRNVSTTGKNIVAKVAYTDIKSGPSKDALSTAHGTVFSPVHTSSIACASCHEYRNSLGFPVFTTYSEWKNSRYSKEGRECQACHMYRVRGDVVDPRVKRSTERKINLHEMPGSHSLKQLTRTIRARLSTTREGDRLQVAVRLENHLAGHYVPTGSPLRQLVLELRVDPYEGGHFREKRVYRRSVTDQDGTVLDREHLVLMKGFKVLEDTRLAPGEKRTETFSFDVPQGVKASVEASFWYYYSPMARTEAEQRIKFHTVTRLVR